ncbi:MAG: hypothetical protein IJ309_01550 [Clostridia bacterium]|nr:hypothetical protein [Clostridia bacterium]
MAIAIATYSLQQILVASASFSEYISDIFEPDSLFSFAVVALFSGYCIVLDRDKHGFMIKSAFLICAILRAGAFLSATMTLFSQMVNGGDFLPFLANYIVSLFGFVVGVLLFLSTFFKVRVISIVGIGVTATYMFFRFINVLVSMIQVFNVVDDSHYAMFALTYSALIIGISMGVSYILWFVTRLLEKKEEPQLTANE